MKTQTISMMELLAALRECQESTEKSKPCSSCVYVNCPERHRIRQADLYDDLLMEQQEQM